MPNAQPLVTSRWNLSSGKAIVLLSAFFVLVVQLILFQPILRDYFPTFDELALLSSSTDIGGATEPAKWFTEGYRYYFFSDQEWPWMRQTTDFMRPGGNFIYWVCYNLFGEHWSAQLVLGYFAHALCVGLVGYIARTLFQLERWWILLAMVLAAFNPAYWWGDDFSLALPWAVQFPAYQTEVMAGLLDLAAFIVFVRRRFILFSVLVTLSLLIKETAITLPLSALLIAGCWRGDTAAATLRNATWLVLPLILWGVLRFIVHEPGGGMYVLHSDRLWIIAPIRHLLMWPTAVDAPLRETVDLLHRHEWFTLSVRALAILMNLVWWAVLGFIAWRVVRTWGNRWLTAAPPPWVIGLVFALGNLGAAVMLQISEPRFGYLWFALGPAAVLVAVSRWKAGPLAAGALSLSLLIAPVSALIDTCSQDMLVHQRTVRQSARQLVSLVRDLPPSVKTVFIVDDVFMRHTAPEFTADLAGFKGKLIRVNNVLPTESCARSEKQAQRYRVTQDGDAAVLDYTRPDCFYRPAPYIEIPANAIEQGNVVQRGPWMSYTFPELRADGPTLDLGKHWTFRASNPECQTAGACVWLGFEPTENRYYALNTAL